MLTIIRRTAACVKVWRMYRIGSVLGLLVLAVSCASIGPKTIQRDQFDYGNSIAAAGREQILSNIVGLRYVEAPMFVDVASVINQYSLEGENLTHDGRGEEEPLIPMDLGYPAAYGHSQNRRVTLELTR